MSWVDEGAGAAGGDSGSGGQGAGASGGQGGAAGGDPAAGAGAGAGGASGAAGAAGTGDPSAGSSSWRDTLPDDIKTSPALKDIKDVAGLAKSYLHAQSLVGRDKVPLPGKDAKPEDWEPVYKALGRPDSPDGYELPTELEGGVKLDEGFLKAFKAQAHKNGLNPAQVKDLFSWYTAAAVERGREAQAQRAKLAQDFEVDLTKTYGATNIPAAKQAANKALAAFGDSGMVNLIKTTGLGSSPELFHFLVKVGRGLAESPMHGSGGGSFTMSPAEAKAEADRITFDPKSPLHDKTHPEHKLYVEKVRMLRSLETPE